MPTKPENKEPAPLQSLHGRDRLNSISGEKKVPVTEEIDLSEDRCTPPSSEKPKPTCTLANARFLPDETSDFNKPCAITVDVQGLAAGPVSFALHATYKGTDYDLQHVQTAPVKSGKAQTMLKLFYVDQHYNDLNVKGDSDAAVEYYAVVSSKAAREIKSDILRMPLEDRVHINFIDENEGVYTDLALKATDGKEIGVNAGRATLNSGIDQVELIFPTIAMNYTPNTTTGIV
jgi:hypothetical protein